MLTPSFARASSPCREKAMTHTACPLTKIQKYFCTTWFTPHFRSSKCTNPDFAPSDHSKPFSSTLLPCPSPPHTPIHAIYKEENTPKIRPDGRIFVIFLSEFIDNFLSFPKRGQKARKGSKKFVRFANEKNSQNPCNSFVILI